MLIKIKAPKPDGEAMFVELLFDEILQLLTTAWTTGFGLAKFFPKK